jgi:hypothetical protein
MSDDWKAILNHAMRQMALLEAEQARRDLDFLQKLAAMEDSYGFAVDRQTLKDAFAAQIRAAVEEEREACARLAKEQATDHDWEHRSVMRAHGQEIADAILARGCAARKEPRAERT